MSQPKDELPTGDHESLMWATIGAHAGRYLYFQGKYEEAEAMHRYALMDREKVLGLGHHNTFNSVDDLDLALAHQGKYQEAEVILRRGHGKYQEAEVIYRYMLRGRKKILGLDHPDTLTSVDNLASVLESQGKYDEANTIHQEAKGRTSY
ncbi:hypothetical protein BDV36DRAFT_301069 [Aspergillus pseudocaelatus]|uniref:Tetratricopeptide repeat-domain-containing protein n=1 Tax=Aspergillus pseudocaelatus TaxID=1825620 RepID=A0ABQ6W560_9EURO|nr:hypothetical protein BDV36DRAFT_301069 [Aspergillus pseudocaelatus]